MSNNGRDLGGDSHHGSITYEQAMASTVESNFPDKVSWDSSSSYRNSPYRHLHHQRGHIGHFHIRLVEGRDLSNGQNRQILNSYAILRLASASPDPSISFFGKSMEVSDKKLPSSSLESSVCGLRFLSRNEEHHNSDEVVRSSPIIQSNNPSWSSSVTSSFRLPLKKGRLQPEGSSVFVHIHVKHDPNADPFQGGLGLPSFGGGEEKKHVGYGLVDVTPLLLGDENIMDVWAPLCSTAPFVAQQSNSTDSTSSQRGAIRLLISYAPHGIRPQPNDLVTFEAFVRNSSNVIFRPTMCQPMKVLALRGDFLLVQYTMPPKEYSRNPEAMVLRTHPSDISNSSGLSNVVTEQPLTPKSTRLGKIRVHRNTVFVIEHISFMDSTVNTVLAPVDLISKLPITKDVGRALSPYVDALGDLAMPALLSGRLIWAAARTTATAGVTGVVTAGKVLVMAAAAGKRPNNPNTPANDNDCGRNGKDSQNHW